MNDKNCYIHITNKYLSRKENKLLLNETIWVNLKGISLRKKKSILKGFILHVSTNMPFMKQQNYSDEESTWRLPVIRDGRSVWLKWSRMKEFGGIAKLFSSLTIPAIHKSVHVLKFVELCTPQKSQFYSMLIEKK